MIRLAGPPSRGFRWTRQAAFLSFREAAAKLYEETRAADLLCDAGVTPSAAVCLDYHARQLVHHAKYGNATLYGKRRPAAVMEPIGRNDLWTGRFADGMQSWIAGNGVEYADLSLRRNDLARLIRQVKRAVKEHGVLLAWCRHHASSHGH